MIKASVEPSKPVKGVAVWLTGLPGAGKTTLARALAQALRARGVQRVEVLDGDEIRETLGQGLGFCKRDRDINIARIAFVSDLLTRNGVCTIVAAVSPYREARDRARGLIGSFVEVYVKCPLDVLMARDPKGLYRRALAGEIPHFTGVSDVYEEPLAPDVIVETHRDTVSASLRRILSALESGGFIASRPLKRRPSRSIEVS